MMDRRTTPSDIYPTLTYADAPAAIDWLCRVFGFQKRLVVHGEEGLVMHSELTLGTGVIMVSSEKPEADRFSRLDGAGVAGGICVRVDDPDAHFANASAGGAKILRELRDEEYGSRGYMVKDLEGHHWYFGTYRPGLYWDGATGGS